MKLVRVLAIAVAFLVFGANDGFSAPGDVVVKRSSKAEETYPPATFPHWPHSIRYRCFVCHPAVFSMTTFATEKGTLKQDRKPFVAPKDETKAAPADAEVSDKADKKNKGEEAKKEPKKEEKEAGKPAEPAKTTAASREQLMHGRQACGLCHDGKIAFRVEFSVCGRCHVPVKQ